MRGPVERCTPRGRRRRSSSSTWTASSTLWVRLERRCSRPPRRCCSAPTTRPRSLATSTRQRWSTVSSSPCVPSQLQRIVAETGCRIVLSTTWRETPPQRRAVDAQLVAAGCPSSCDCTPRLSVLRGGRPAEILAYVREHAVTSWVALDDVDLRTSSAPAGPVLPDERFVLVPAATGLSQASADEAIRKLQPPLTFDALPQELVVLIMRGGSPRSTLALSACSRALRAASLLDEVWRAHLLEMGFSEMRSRSGRLVAARRPTRSWRRRASGRAGSRRRCWRATITTTGCTRPSSSRSAPITSRGGGKAAASLWPAWNSQTHSTCRCGRSSCLAASRPSTPARSRRGRRATPSSCFRRASRRALPVTEGSCTASSGE